MFARYWKCTGTAFPPRPPARITDLRGTGRLSVLHGQVTAVTEQARHCGYAISQGSGTAECTRRLADQRHRCGHGHHRGRRSAAA